MTDRVRAEFPKQTLHHDEERRGTQSLVHNYQTGLFQGWGPKI